MEEKAVFQSEVRYDLATYKEFERINICTTPRATFSGLFSVVCMVYLFSMLDHSFTAKTALVFSIFVLSVWVF